MIDKAIKKINEEIQKAPEDMYIAAVGEFIIDNITTEEAAKLILNGGKDLAGALGLIKTKARALAKNGCAIVRNDEVYQWAMDYFGLKGTVQPQPTEKPEEPKGISIALDDFF